MINSKNILKFLAFTYVFVTSFSTTIAFFTYGNEIFILLTAIFISSGFYYNQSMLLALRHKALELYENLNNIKNNLKEKKLSVFLFTVSFLLAIVPIVFFFVNSIVYTFAFLNETFGISSAIMPVIYSVFVPISIITFCNYISDIFDSLILLQDKLKDLYKSINTYDVLKLLIAIPVAVYLSLGIVKLNIVAMQMYKLTILGNTLVYPVAFVFHIILFTASFITLTGIILKILDRIKDYLSKESNSINLLNRTAITNIFCFLSQTSITLFASSIKSGAIGPSSLSSVFSSVQDATKKGSDPNANRNNNSSGRGA